MRINCPQGGEFRLREIGCISAAATSPPALINEVAIAGRSAAAPDQ
jgi:hypothetical protein